MKREPSPHKHSILVVENEHDIRVSLRIALESEGCTVDSATNGREAIEALRRMKPPCLIILDLMMPIMSGPDFLKAVFVHPTFSRIPVLVVTAGKLDNHQFPSQVVGVMGKPLDLPTLLKFIHQHCNCPSNPE